MASSLVATANSQAGTANSQVVTVDIQDSSKVGTANSQGGTANRKVDMANHNGASVPHTAKGLDSDGRSFVVIATAPIAKGTQVNLSYGPLPNMLLLQQWGFVLPQLSSPPDIALVNIGHLLLEGGAMLRALEEVAAKGMLMRERDGSPSGWQPAGRGPW